MRCSFDLETVDSGVRPEGYPEPNDLAPDTRGYIMPWLGSVLCTGIAEYPNTAWVGVVTVGVLATSFTLEDTAGEKARVTVETFVDEYALLRATWARLADHADVATWRGDFDFGWLEFRSAVRGIKATGSSRWFHTRYDRRSRWIDWADILTRHGTFRDVKGAWSLPTACWAFGNRWHPKGTGADIPHAAAVGNWDFIIEHQARDVLATAEIDARCAGLYLEQGGR